MIVDFKPFSRWRKYQAQKKVEAVSTFARAHEILPNQIALFRLFTFFTK